MMRLSVTSWSFPRCTLAEAAAIGRALGLEGLDVGFHHRPALDRAALLADPEGAARKLIDLGVRAPNLYAFFGETLEDRQLADPRHRARNAADFAGMARFCAAAGIGSVFVLPGVVSAGVGRREAMGHAADALRELMPIARDHGVTLTVEPHVRAFLESPALTLELLERVPGLKLTLDYAHFVCLGHTQDAIDPLAPHAAHVHVRQARPGALQAKLDLGTINIPAMVETLRAVGYAGWLSIEFVHQDYMGTLHDDVLSETIATRDLLRALLDRSAH